MASKEEFYQSINEDTFAGADFCRKLYGYCYTDAVFLEKVLDKLRSFGRDKFIYIYSTFVQMEIYFQTLEQKEAAAWLAERIDRNYERKVKEAEWEKRKLQNMTRSELTELCQKLLRAGIITEPEQFATMVLQGR